MADTWRTVVLKVLNDRENKFKPGSRYQIRVVQKIKNGQHVAVKVQVGEEYVKSATGELAFKTTDMGIMDIDKINEHLVEIKALIKNPPAVEPDTAPADDVSF